LDEKIFDANHLLSGNVKTPSNWYSPVSKQKKKSKWCTSIDTLFGERWDAKSFCKNSYKNDKFQGFCFLVLMHIKFVIFSWVILIWVCISIVATKHRCIMGGRYFIF
jgi:hypothetical protein